MTQEYPYKKILVTGGGGFIGSSYIKNLLENYNGFEIMNLDIMSYAASQKTLDLFREYENFHHSHIDISDLEKVKKIFKVFSPNLVVNFAAESHVDNSIYGAAPFIQSNIVGTFNLLEASKNLLDNSNFLFHQISTDEVFGDLDEQDPAFKETDPYDPSSPYSASKASSDMLVSAWGRTYQMPYLITNCSNNFGPRQYKEKLIPKIICNTIDGIEIPVYGNGLNIRDWIFVDDHTDTIIELHKKDIKSERFNIGGNNEIGNLELIKEIMQILESKYELSPKIKFVKDRQGHDKRYAINMTKTDKFLNRNTKYNFSKNLEATIEWYIKNVNWWDE